MLKVPNIGKNFHKGSYHNVFRQVKVFNVLPANPKHFRGEFRVNFMLGMAVVFRGLQNDFPFFLM
jgi:hypothetical protein